MIGPHVSLKDDNIIKIANKIKKDGGNVMQIFINFNIFKNNNLSNIREYLIKNNIKLIIHSSFLNNLCRNWDKYSWWLKNLEKEIKYAHELGAEFVVLHLGKRLNLTLEEAYNNMYTSLIYIHSKTKQYSNVKILLETPTGQGTQICYKIEDFSKFYKKISKNPNKEIRKRFKICIDTCHIFTAGYDITSKNNIINYLKKFNELIGLKYIKLIHLNDSKIELGGMLDRHQDIGQGYIGLKALKYFYNFSKKNNIPVILETKLGETNLINEINKLIN